MGPVYQKAGGGNYIEFLAPGIVAMSILFTAIFSGIEVIWDRQFGFLKETLVAPVSRLEIMIGRTLGSATVATLQGCIVLALAYLAGFRIVSWANLPIALVFMVLIALLFTALGTAIASVLDDMQGFQLIMNFLVMPLFFLSGALFPMAGLPGALKVVVRANPLAYGVDGLRHALIGISTFGTMLNFSVLLIITFLLFVSGAYLFSKIEI